jgi:hypothetical protein
MEEGSSSSSFVFFSVTDPKRRLSEEVSLFLNDSSFPVNVCIHIPLIMSHVFTKGKTSVKLITSGIKLVLHTWEICK